MQQSPDHPTPPIVVLGSRKAVSPITVMNCSLGCLCAGSA